MLIAVQSTVGTRNSRVSLGFASITAGGRHAVCLIEDVIQPAHVLALSLLTLGASTLHGIRSSSVPAPILFPTLLRPLTLVGTAQAAALANARERAERNCSAPRSRAREASACADH